MISALITQPVESLPNEAFSNVARLVVAIAPFLFLMVAAGASAYLLVRFFGGKGA
ncbi:MAG TPA: hypothetical protein VFW38_01940 [Solirubrobacteraceae bacterium]|nr:hypothetical protein [Solirubrobacteraceae bacterium]